MATVYPCRMYECENNDKRGRCALVFVKMEMYVKDDKSEEIPTCAEYKKIIVKKPSGATKAKPKLRKPRK